MFALSLLMSVVGLALGPALVALGRGRALTTASIEGLTLGLVPLLIGMRLLPHVVEELGPVAVALAAAGYASLWLVDRRRHGLGDRVGQAIIVPTLALHALTDGAGLSIAFAASREQGSAGALVALAIIMHRIPEGLFIATRLLPALGWPRTLGWIGALAGTTVVGALAGHTLLERIPEAPLDAIVAFGLGAMLRMIIHAHGPVLITRGVRAVSGLTFLFGVAAVLAIPSPDSLLESAASGELSVGQVAAPLFVKTAPALLIGLLTAGLLRALLPSRAEGELKGGPALSQAARGVVFGFPGSIEAEHPVPLLKRLLSGGASPAAASGALLSRLELDIAAAALAVPLLGGAFTAARLAFGALLAVVVALIVARSTASSAASKESALRGRAREEGSFTEPAFPSPELLPESGAAPGSPGASASIARLPARVGQSLIEGCTTALDPIGAWFVAGLILAAALEATLPRGIASAFGAPAEVLLAVILSIALPLCPHGATPIAAVLLHKGLSAGAAFTLLAAVPGTSLSVLSLLRRRLGVRATAAFSIGVVLCSILAGFATNSKSAHGSLPDLHTLALEAPGPIHLGSAALVAALLIASLLRLGPREWLSRMSADADPHGGCHSHSSPHAVDRGGAERADVASIAALK